MISSQQPKPFQIDKNFEMPSVPVVLTKILRLVDDNRATAKKLEELILHDPALSARILKLANSAFYSFRSEVKTISHAIALLGLNLVKSLAIGVSIFESFTKGLKHEAAHINKLWMHSFGVGLTAQDIWIQRTDKVEGEFAFLCGLLHDLGKVVYFKQDPRRYSQIFAMEKEESDPDMCTLEVEGYGANHATLGAMLAEHWGLPPELATVVQQHHDPLAAKLPLVQAVSMADAVAKQTGIGYDGDNKVVLDLEALRTELAMGMEEFEGLLASAETKKKDVEEFFQQLV
jgi:putative nucleotidyltransferase with HDIG domain